MVPTKLPGQLPANSMLTIGDGGLPVTTSRANAKALQMSVQDLLKLEQETLTQEDAGKRGHCSAQSVDGRLPGSFCHRRQLALGDV